MFLEKLELAGFKSFAKKTNLEFFPPAKGCFSITGIVGPNGSGKSNVADAIRWVLGEQSMKLLRGKRGEDVIFSGSGRAARKSLSEVTLILNNEDRTLENFGTEIAITRRLYRSGDSEYLINKKVTRLTDIVLLLARAQIGQNSYSVIGQGMVDHVVVASPAERRAFFDEATGVKEFQLKREQTANKLDRTRINLREAEMLLREMEPRRKSLKRQVNRLDEKEEVVRELEDVRKQYYGMQWYELATQRDDIHNKLKELTRNEEQVQREHDKLLKQMRELENAQEEQPAMNEMQKEYEQLMETRQKINTKLAKLQSALAIAKARKGAEPSRTMIEIDTLTDEIEALYNEHVALVKSVGRNDGYSIKRALDRLGGSIKRLRDCLGKHLPEKKQDRFEDGTEEEEKDLREKLVVLDVRIKEVRDVIKFAAQQSTKDKSAFFELQRALQEKQEAMHRAERALHDVDIQRTRVQTQLESLEQEIKSEAPKMLGIVKSITAEDVVGVNINELRPKVFDLRRKSEMIESIDPEVQEEFSELDERYTFLKTQVRDLIESLRDLESVVRELDRRIQYQRNSAFEELNKEFQHFFEMLFDGGKAVLVPVEAVAKNDEEKESPLHGEKAGMRGKAEAWAGIEIRATPPGKKIQSIHTLSGGERAMTAIALICAIVTINPSPFVVLDEVDAALDESNSARFAEILQELSSKAQFIVITHNRATMHAANALYGVTMGDDGISNLVSMKLVSH